MYKVKSELNQLIKKKNTYDEKHKYFEYPLYEITVK